MGQIDEDAPCEFRADDVMRIARPAVRRAHSIAMGSAGLAAHAGYKAGTCRSWRAAFSSYPSKSTLCTLIPSHLVQPHITVHAPNLPSRSDDGHKLGTCQVVDPANMKSTLRYQVPEETFEKLCIAGSSYGQLICGCGRNCLIMDVFTGAKVFSPQLPFTNNTYLYCGMLTTPLASPNSHLLVCALPEKSSPFLLDWLIGSDFWSKLQLNLNDSVIMQIVEFNGQFITRDNYHRLYTLSLAPPTCLSLASYGAPVNYKAYCLDMSTEPATWVEVVKLENDALFMGRDVRSPAFSCMSPGRWGERNNCLYYAHDSQSWVLHGMGHDADVVWDDSTDPDLVYSRGLCLKLQPFWVYPSMFYLDGQ
ncbi:unnamed protein product [Miscanthus lutarioriparius]|uniref:DUF295 domain-containing protein n=1 Tax=Miscanthus lutarioriparius TaxID=422564 RepID=A0A811SJ25_9POAL|nr:unnamed protein product [Miscanthus lutarioriparius]